MRIRKSKLGIPDYEYTTVLKGKWVMIKLYHDPEYCVQVITSKDTQCYPLTFEQYNNYCDNAEMTLHPSRAILEAQLLKAEVNINLFNEDQNLKKFWINVMDHYLRRFRYE